MRHLRSIPSRLPFDPGCLAAAALPLIGIALAYWSDGLIRAADSAIHLHRLYAMQLLYRQGVFWPRWVSYFHLGYGYPIFNFYPPLAYHLGAILGLVGIGAPVAFNLIMAGAWIGGSVGTYALARTFLPGSGAILAAMLWTYAPSRLFEVWNQGSLAQTVGAALIPWLLLGLVRAARHPTPRALVGVAVPAAALAMTHLPLTIMTALFAVPLGLLLTLWHARRHPRAWPRRLLGLAGAGLLAAGLAAIFILPVAGELRYVQARGQDPVPELRDNFLELRDLLRQPTPLDLADAQFLILPTLGLSWAWFALVGMAGLVWRRRYGAALLLALGLASLVFLAQAASLPVWTTVPFLANARFPWRLFRVGAVLIALAGGAGLLMLPRRWRTPALVIALPLALIPALPWLIVDKPLDRWDNLSARDEIAYEETVYHWGTTSYNEFNPVWGARIAVDPAPEPEAYQSHPFRLIVHRQDILQQWPDLAVEELDDSTVRVTVADGRPVRFRQYYYPGWTAALDGEPAALYPDDDLGLITVDTPPGEHTITLHYAGTPLQTLAAAISLLSAGAAAILVWAGRRTEAERATVGRATVGRATVGRATSDRTTGRAESLSPRASFAIAGGAVIFALLSALYIRPHTMWFRDQSPPDAPISMETPVHAFFGESIELLGYTLGQESAAPGGTVDLTLFWRLHGEVAGSYRAVVELVSPLAEVYGRDRKAVILTSQFRQFYQPGMFLSEIHRLGVADDAPPYTGRVRIAVVDVGDGTPLLTPDGADAVLLPTVIPITGSDPPAARRLDDRLGEGLTLACASIARGEGEIAIDLFWHVEAAPAHDYTVFLHGLDAGGEMVAQNDGPPLGGRYPTSLWRPGQNLSDHHTLPANPAITAVAVGLYRPDTGDRLPVTQDGQPVPDGRIVLPLAATDCLP